MISNVRVVNIDDDVDECRNITQGKIYTWIWWKLSTDALHMYAENEPAMKINEVVRNDVLSELYILDKKIR